MKMKNYFLKIFPNPDALSKGNERDPYGTLKAYFSDANNTVSKRKTNVNLFLFNFLELYHHRN